MRRKRGEANYESENLTFYKPLLPAGAISASALRRSGVDGRVKPGHDGFLSRHTSHSWTEH
jgi:hypothetical protein